MRIRHQIGQAEHFFDSEAAYQQWCASNGIPPNNPPELVDAEDTPTDVTPVPPASSPEG